MIAASTVMARILRRRSLPRSRKICVVCQKQHRGRIEQFVRKFLDGMVGSPQSKKRQPFTKGFVRKYALKNATVELVFLKRREMLLRLTVRLC